MNSPHDLPETRDPSRDPLERLVEAFVDLSVPEGPDPAVRTRLVATLYGVEGAARSTTPRRSETRDRRSSVANVFVWAAACLAIVAASRAWIVARQAKNGAPAPILPDALAAEKSSVDEPGEVLDLLDFYLQAERPSRQSLPDLAAMLNAVLRERPELRDSARWRQAQQKLSVALDRPEVIGVGMGLLGALPWTN